FLIHKSNLSADYSVLRTIHLSDQTNWATTSWRPTVPSTEPVKTQSPAHPASLRNRLSRPWALKMAPCLCNRMGRLVGKAQVHPGRSGLEKVGLFQADQHTAALADLKTLPSRDPPDHVVVQSRAHVHIHVTSQRLYYVQCNLQARLTARDIAGAQSEV